MVNKFQELLCHFLPNAIIAGFMARVFVSFFGGAAVGLLCCHTRTYMRTTRRNVCSRWRTGLKIEEMPALLRARSEAASSSSRSLLHWGDWCVVAVGGVCGFGHFTLGQLSRFSRFSRPPLSHVWKWAPCPPSCVYFWPLACCFREALAAVLFSLHRELSRSQSSVTSLSACVFFPCECVCFCF